MMKKWKKTHRQRVKYRERKLIKVHFTDFPKHLYVMLKLLAIRQGKSINDVFRSIIRDKMKEIKDNKK